MKIFNLNFGLFLQEVLLVLLVVFGTVSVHAQGQVVDWTFDPLSVDFSEVSAKVYLPEGHDPDASQPYPILLWNMPVVGAPPQPCKYPMWKPWTT